MALTSSGTATVTLPTEEQILITREFDAPKHLVWKAFTTPELVKRWWNAKRGEMTVAEIDLQVGGKWRYVMVTDDGIEVGFHGEYREVVLGERIVSTETYEGVPEGVSEEDATTVNTATFAETDGRTTLTHPRAGEEQGVTGRDHRVRDGSRAAGRARPSRGGRGLARLSRTRAGHRERCARWPARRRRLQTYASRASSGRGTLVGASASTKSGAYLIFPA